ncbi:hypothetical protein OEZ49_19555 [Ruegeria sp. WL0004]|uniref:Guanylate cyclase domain-containing protein n=1 Tax=Ruegeria marisflavi TaxID=2984152 RepID=A0ABT2WVN6_9RHOB|nr:adenylate/guanylate cyclase domain-containing protein [Ruegeria sp. WL0004]MCU9839969.1 hypothetical protein [Ruegeria sp. WL0004]
MASTSPAAQPLVSGAEESGGVRTILFVDMVGYSRRVEVDELSALDFMSGCFDTLRVLAHRHGGAVVKTMGDGALLVFPDSVSAVRLGIEFHRIVQKIQTGVRDPNLFRIGIHAGPIIERNGDVLGNAVNVAARLQEQAQPGTCLVSEVIRDGLSAEHGIRFEAAGTQRLKNLSQWIEAFRVIDAPSASTGPPESENAVIAVLGQTGLIGADGRRRMPGSRHARSLLGYLALCPGHCEAPDRLVALMWPEARNGTVLGPLDDTVDELNHLLPERMRRLLLRDDRFVMLDAMAFQTDLDSFEHALRRGSVPETLSSDGRWPDRILIDADGLSPEFDGWLRILRASWKRRLMQGLERVLEQTAGNADSHRAAAEAILRQEPGNEVASLALIRHFVVRGSMAPALEEFTRLQEYLSRTHGAQSGPEILQTVRRVLDGKSRKTPPADALEAAPRPRRMLRLLVDRFTAPVADEHLARTFRADLMANLARFREWSVIDGDRNAGSDERADYGVAGELHDDPVRAITIRLTEKPTHRMIWSETYDVETGGWYAAQLSIVRQVAAAIERYVSADRLAATLSTPGARPTSHDTWLRGDRAMMRWTPEGAEEARAIFSSLLEEDPDYAPAMTSLASMTNISHVVWPGLTRNVADTQRADALAARAAEIDPMDSRNQRAVAWSAALNGSFARASMHLDLALKLNPVSPTTLASCAMGFAWFGEREKADATVTRLFAVSEVFPEWIWGYLASTLFLLDRFDKAVEAAEIAGDSIVDIQGWLAAALQSQGHGMRARAAAERFVSRVSDVWAGSEPATPHSVRDWFVTAFPIRRKEDRSKLATALDAAMGLSGQ